MRVLGIILELLYRLVQNYGVSILLFTVFIKLILLPLTIKQQKSLLKTQRLQPLLMEIQKKYGNDKEKLNMETMKLYQQFKINPMSGCLPMFIQLPIIFALYWVVRKPITYIMGVDASEIWRVYNAFMYWAQNGGAEIVSDNLKNIDIGRFGAYEIEVAQYMFKYPEILNHPQIAQWGETLKTLNFNFLGLNIAATPNLGALIGLCLGRIEGLTLETALIWIVPVLSGFSTWLSTKFTTMTRNNGETAKTVNSNEPNPADSMKTMTLIMPFMTAFFTFSVPVAVGLYWITSNLIQIVIQFIVNKIMSKEIEKEINIDDIKEGMANVKKGNKKRKKSR